LIINLGGPAEVARGEGHFAHGFDEWHDVVLFDVDVLDNFNKKIGFFWFHDFSSVVPMAARFCS
jgi:hypothetical protein